MKIKAGYLGATPPGSWWAKLLCRIIGAKTWHWFIFVRKIEAGWIISESIGKGTALTVAEYPEIFVYRIKGLKVSDKEIVNFHALFGEYGYDWDVAFKTTLWWFLKHYLGIIIPGHRDKEVNCQEYVALFAEIMGKPIIPLESYPMCVNLENSKALKYLGEINERENSLR